MQKTLDFITLGETMIRLSPPVSNRLEEAEQLNLFVGGSESNVAVGMARLGKRSAWVSRLPENPLGHLVANKIRSYGVDVSGVQWAAGERMGTYFVESGSPPRPSRVWYDRANSAASQMTPADLPLALIESASWLHVTGITPALSSSCAEMARGAMDFAKEKGLTVSFDVNFRALLWSAEAAGVALEPLCKAADVVFLAARDGRSLFGSDDLQDLHQRWGGTVAMTRGADGASICAGDEIIDAAAYPVTLVDRLGAGDAFASGVMCQMMDGASLFEAVRYGCAVAALKLTIPGDFSVVTRSEVDALIQQGGSSIHR